MARSSGSNGFRQARRHNESHVFRSPRRPCLTTPRPKPHVSYTAAQLPTKWLSFAPAAALDGAWTQECPPRPLEAPVVAIPPHRQQPLCTSTVSASFPPGVTAAQAGFAFSHPRNTKLSCHPVAKTTTATNTPPPRWTCPRPLTLPVLSCLVLSLCLLSAPGVHVPAPSVRPPPSVSTPVTTTGRPVAPTTPMHRIPPPRRAPTNFTTVTAQVKQQAQPTTLVLRYRGRWAYGPRQLM